MKEATCSKNSQFDIYFDNLTSNWHWPSLERMYYILYYLVGIEQLRNVERSLYRAECGAGWTVSKNCVTPLMVSNVHELGTPS